MTISVSPQNNLTFKYSCLKCFMIWLVSKENKSSLRFETATFFIPVAWYYPCRENKSACLFTIFTLAHSLLEYIYIFSYLNVILKMCSLLVHYIVVVWKILWKQLNLSSWKAPTFLFPHISRFANVDTILAS